MGCRGKHEASRQVKGIPVSRQEVVGPELTMTEAPAVAGVAGCRVAFGDGRWMWGGVRERKNRTSSWVRC